ncbi:putative siderophore iron transporter [Paraphoma chrysanthemicola]|uniref:Siderophore iron transporter n=1 Tax=Paraphoma chrysanthemicola TaxID=798071 RepID=A0A8K0R8J1_9PLEO|nr:putative siderophore iron transporter [Paraphoma chrysanthemicola]
MASHPAVHDVGVVTNSEKSETGMTEHKEHVSSSYEHVYENAELEPEIHWRTYIALLAMVLINYVAVISLQAPPAVLNFIGNSLDAADTQTWIPNAPNLICGAIGPILSSASDMFQARKNILLVGCAMGVIGCAIVPGSSSISRVIVGQTVKGFGYATTPLLYAIPSEILPNKWRPMAQAIINIGAATASISGPLAIGALVKNDPVHGWRKFWWIEMAMWAASLISIYFGYNPPKRRTEHDSLTWIQKLGKLDIPGSLLLTAAVTLLLVGLGLGGGQYSWSSSRVIATIVVGGVLAVAFGIYEWKGTRAGILHHDLFLPGRPNGRTFGICTGLFAVEAILIITFTIFYPILTQALYESDPFKIVARGMPYWVATILCTPIWAYLSSRYRNIRWPMFGGFFIWTAGAIGFATLQPDTGFNSMAFAGLSGIGFAAPLVMIIAGVQLSVPHDLIATATSVATSSRALANAITTSVYVAIFRKRLSSVIPARIPPAVIAAGLPLSSIPGFIGALTANNPSALMAVPGVTPSIINIGAAAYKQALADSIRIVFIITAVIGTLGTGCVILLDNMKERMNYQTDAPVEDLHAKGIEG